MPKALSFTDYLISQETQKKQRLGDADKLLSRVRLLEYDYGLKWRHWTLIHCCPLEFDRPYLNNSELKPKPFYALLCNEWLIGVQHYIIHENKRSLNKAQGDIAKLLASFGWQATECTIEYCGEEEWAKAAHRREKLKRVERVIV